MIYSVRGKLTHKEPFLAVVECAGVGYACRTTCSTSAQLGETGKEVYLYTYLHVREDNVELFGFYSMQELNCFKMLISVSGVGPKAALSILSDIDAQRFALTVASGDSKVFTKTKGVGPKLAQRIVLELKDKIAKESITTSDIKSSGNIFVPEGDNCAEAVSALMVLGFSQEEVAAAVSKIDTSLDTGEIVKQALKIIGKK
ncbi:MAG: Holliday junction branch migration protein RuvA [Ruminococcus sp.]|jgi:holliday junction DNA helicase ruvA|nr:Holliday junction branch migration protein RuvA [Ruminococcus sp.]